MFAENGAVLFEIFKKFAKNYFDDKNYIYSLELPNLGLCSKQLEQILWKSTIQNAKEFDKRVEGLIEFIWKEAIEDLNENFKNGFENLLISEVNKLLINEYFKK